MEPVESPEEMRPRGRSQASGEMRRRGQAHRPGQASSGPQNALRPERLPAGGGHRHRHAPAPNERRSARKAGPRGRADLSGCDLAAVSLPTRHDTGRGERTEPPRRRWMGRRRRQPTAGHHIAVVPRERTVRRWLDGYTDRERDQRPGRRDRGVCPATGQLYGGHFRGTSPLAGCLGGLHDPRGTASRRHRRSTTLIEPGAPPQAAMALRSTR